MANELSPEAVQAALMTRWLGRSYYYLSEVGSTNTYLKNLLAADEPPPAGTVVLANFQSQGRGRLDRRWEAPPGSSLLFSILLRPNWPAEQSNWVTLLGATAAAAAMAQAKPLAVGIKWPNDLMVNVTGQWRKVCGLLLEGDVNEQGLLQWAILGIGINVNISPDDLPAASTPPTSLLAASSTPVSRLALLAALLAELEKRYEAIENGRSPHDEWQQQLLTLGQTVAVKHATDETVVAGVAEGTDAWGHLLVRDREGQLHTITAGDVTMLR